MMYSDLNIQKENFSSLLQQQKAFFAAGSTLSQSFRTTALNKLLQALKTHEPDLLSALKEDLGKSYFEGYETELAMVYSEIRTALKQLGQWMKPQKVSTPITHFPAKSRVIWEPYGSVLILAPWNYPIQLCLVPLVSALAAGCCAVIKPAEEAGATEKALVKVIQEAFSPEHVAIVTGGIEASEKLLELAFDKIFFTGSPRVGKIVMRAAAEHLTPVTLELGGKSPCIVTSNANLSLAAKRIAWGKWLNCGQTCVAPDFLLVHKSIEKPFLKLLVQQIQQQYGNDPLNNPDYPHLIHACHYQRLAKMVEEGPVFYGGQTDEKRNAISPTLLFPVRPEQQVMQEEIFGPLLPILLYETQEEVISFLQSRPKPLALYLFSQSKQERDFFFSRLSFGGGCWNDTILHLSTSALPFGGVGNSGMGQYHGKAGFEAFCHPKALLLQGSKIDMPVRYPPYNEKKEKTLRRFLH